MSENEEFEAENTIGPDPQGDNLKTLNAPDETGATVAETDTDAAVPDTKEEEKPPKKPVKIPLFAAVIAVLTVAILTSQITFLTVRQSYHKKLTTVEKERFSDSKLSEVDEIYRKYYINGVDDDKLVDGLVEGYIYGTGDKYASYMTSEQYEEYVEGLNSKTDGIGASVIWNTEIYAIEIINVYEGSGAEDAGIQIGDMIIAVDGADVAELGYDAAVSAVKGEAGTKVKLTIYRDNNYDEPIEVECVRKAIDIKTVTFKAYGEVAVIGISNFYASTPTELKAAVSDAAAAGCSRIVFDLRNNTGGLLTSVHQVLDFILPEGPVVRMKDAAGGWSELTSDESCLDMPMVIMVNNRTASAAELFTSALMDYDYAEVIGTQTYGKGTVTTPFQLSDGSVIYVSTNLYYPPKSDNFEGKGITPDEIVELSEQAKKINFYKLTYETDNQLQRAIEIIKEK